MAKRRSRGDGGLFWHDERKRWIAEITIGYKPSGKRIVKRVSGKTKTETKRSLSDLLRAIDDGAPVSSDHYTVKNAVEDWLQYGLVDRDPNTVKNRTYLATSHIVPALGARKLKELSAEDVDRWLENKAKELSTSTLQRLRLILKQAINRAQARDKVRRNVVLLCACPTGLDGRPSKSLTLAQAEALLKATEQSTLGAYIVVSLLSGIRTEEVRALEWTQVDLKGDIETAPPVPPHVKVWRSVRATGDTKTAKSRRSIKMPRRCVDALLAHQAVQAELRAKAGDKWQEHGLVFTTRLGTPMEARNVRRAFRIVTRRAGLNPEEWAPRQLRHSFVSLMSNARVPIEEISRLVGHNSTKTTETVYRHQISPVVEGGADAMDDILPSEDR